MQANLERVEAAERAGVRRFVFVSVWGAPQRRDQLAVAEARERRPRRLESTPDRGARLCHLGANTPLRPGSGRFARRDGHPHLPLQRQPLDVPADVRPPRPRRHRRSRPREPPLGPPLPSTRRLPQRRLNQRGSGRCQVPAWPPGATVSRQLRRADACCTTKSMGSSRTTCPLRIISSS